MENMKSLADQIRRELDKPKPVSGKNSGRIVKQQPVPKLKEKVPDILKAILEYDNSQNKSMVHARFDEKTVRLMNQFKLAADVDVTRLVAFAVKEFFENHPELKTIIKQLLQNTEL